MIALFGILFFSQLDHFGFATISTPQTAGQAFTITLYAYDAGNNIYPYNGPARVFASPGIQYGSLDINFTNGTWTGQFIATLADTYALSCQDYATPPHTGQSNSVVFDPNSAYQMLIIMPGQTYYPGVDSGKIGLASPQTAGIEFYVDVYETDRWSNRVSSSDSIEITASDGFAAAVRAQLMNGHVNLPYSMRTASSQRLFAVDLTNGSIQQDVSSYCSIYPAAYSRLLVLLPGETELPGDTTSGIAGTPGKSGLPQAQYQGDTFLVKVYATDSMWNQTSANGGMVHLYSDFSFSNPAPETLSIGEANFIISYNNAGENQNIWAEDYPVVSYRTYLDILAVIDTSVVTDSFLVYPNPLGLDSGNSMVFVYYLSAPCNIILNIYDPYGNLVHEEEITSGQTGAQSGINRLIWNGRNERGNRVASGIYYAILKGWTHTATVFNQKIKVGVVW